MPCCIKVCAPSNIARKPHWRAGFLFRGLGRCLVALKCVYLLILQETLIGKQVFFSVVFVDALLH